MTDEELVQELRRIAADNHRCFGCGYEHNCSIHGCRIIKSAANTIARLSAHVVRVERERDIFIQYQIPSSPHPNRDTSIEACQRCGSGEYLYNVDGTPNRYCGQCGQMIDWIKYMKV